MTPLDTRDLFKLRKVCVLVPTYNNEQTLGAVIESILEYTNQIVVVNDGSTDATHHVLDRFTGILKVGYPENKGKGFALRAGFKRALEAGYEYAITIDSDGQHFAEDLPKFMKSLNCIRPLL